MTSPADRPTLFDEVMGEYVTGLYQPPPPPPAHHPDCDGWVMHSVQAQRTTAGTYVPACPVCGPLDVIGSAGSPETAVSMGRGHSESVPCDGSCRDW